MLPYDGSTSRFTNIALGPECDISGWSRGHGHGVRLTYSCHGGLALGALVLSRVLDARGRQHFWQRGGGYDRNVYSERQLLEKIEYIHGNPVRRNRVPISTDWGWSSAQAYEQNGAPDTLIEMPPVCPDL